MPVTGLKERSITRWPSLAPMAQGWGPGCRGTLQAELQREQCVTGSAGHNWWLCHLLAKAGKLIRGLLWGHLSLGAEWLWDRQQCPALGGMLWWEGRLGWGVC